MRLPQDTWVVKIVQNIPQSQARLSPMLCPPPRRRHYALGKDTVLLELVGLLHGTLRIQGAWMVVLVPLEMEGEGAAKVEEGEEEAMEA